MTAPFVGSPPLESLPHRGPNLPAPSASVKDPPTREGGRSSRACPLVSPGSRMRPLVALEARARPVTPRAPRDGPAGRTGLKHPIASSKAGSARAAGHEDHERDRSARPALISALRVLSLDRLRAGRTGAEQAIFLLHKNPLAGSLCLSRVPPRAPTRCARRSWFRMRNRAGRERCSSGTPSHPGGSAPVQRGTSRPQTPQEGTDHEAASKAPRSGP